MANDTSNYPDFVFIAYDEDFSAQTHDVAVSLEAGSLVGVPVKYVRNDLNTRLAAPVEGLEVVAYQYKLNDAWYLSDAPETLRKAGYELRELVTRENAEAVIANVEAEKAKAIREAGKHFAKTCMMAEEIETLQADNAVLTARVKELEIDLGARQAQISFLELRWKEAEALETQLAAAKKALEWYANPEIYRPHPHGIGFEDRDKSYVAKSALEAKP
ncbi:hypothetical protein [Brucella pituitosa]